MVTITTYGAAKLNTDNLNFYSMLDLARHTTTSTLYGAYGLGGYDTELRGSGFKYTAAGVPNAGTVTSITFYQDFTKAFTITGMSASMAAIAKLAASGYTTDDKAFFVTLLAGVDTIRGGSNADRINGYAGNDKLFGGAGNDYVRGGVGNDAVDGGDGNDTIYGDAGSDWLYGGKGRDLLYGGAGADKFVFTSVNNSRATEGIDEILDFSRAQLDKIDLSAIDANSPLTGNQAFVFLDLKNFTGRAGELRLVQNGQDTFVYGDLNGDKTADFRFTVHTAYLDKGDFIL